MIFNQRYTSEVWIDPHYELRHRDSINDELILDLVIQLNGAWIEPHKMTGYFYYFEIDEEYQDRNFRLILVTSRCENYLGVINVYRRNR